MKTRYPTRSMQGYHSTESLDTNNRNLETEYVFPPTQLPHFLTATPAKPDLPFLDPLNHPKTSPTCSQAESPTTTPSTSPHIRERDHHPSGRRQPPPTDPGCTISGGYLESVKMHHCTVIPVIFQEFCWYVNCSTFGCCTKVDRS